MSEKYMYFLALIAVALHAQGALSFVTEDGCNKTKTCAFFPAGCSLTEDNCRFASWAKSNTAESIDIELSGGKEESSVNYIAFAFGTTDKMQDADVYFCGDSELRTATIKSQHDAPVEMPLENGIETTKVGMVGGKTQCKFTRPNSITKTISGNANHAFDVTKNSYYILMAQGSLEDEEVNYHNWRGITSDKINFTANFESEMLPTTPPAITTQPSTGVPAVTEQGSANETMQTKVATKQPITQSITKEMTLNGISPNATRETTTSKAIALQATLWYIAAIFASASIL